MNIGALQSSAANQPEDNYSLRYSFSVLRELLMNLAVVVDICVAIKTHPEYNPHQTVYYCYNMLLAVKWL